MGRAHNQRTNPDFSQDSHVVSMPMAMAGGTHAALKLILHLSEVLGSCPRAVKKPALDTVEVGWLWSIAPDIIPTVSVAPDIVIRLIFRADGKMEIQRTVGLLCPEPAEKENLIDDAMLLFNTDMAQGGFTAEEEAPQ